MLRGIGRLRARSSGDATASAWAAAVTANGGTYSAATLTAVTNFCVSAKAKGYFSKFNRINLFCGNQLAAALVPLVATGGNSTDTNVNFLSGDYTEATGLTGNGTTKYLRTGLVPSVSLTLNSTHLAVYNRAANAGAGGGATIGASDANTFRILAPFSDGNLYSDQYDTGTGRLSAAVAATYGLLTASRTASNAHAIYKGATSVASNATGGGALPAVELMVFCENTSGTAGLFVAYPLGAYSIGTGLSPADVANYNTDMLAFQTALSRNV